MQICLVIWILTILIFPKMTPKYFAESSFSEYKTGYNELACVCQWKCLSDAFWVRECIVKAVVFQLFAQKDHVLQSKSWTFILLLTLLTVTYHQTAAVTTASIFFLLPPNLTQASLHLVSNNLKKKKNDVHLFYFAKCFLRSPCIFNIFFLFVCIMVYIHLESKKPN